MAEPKPIILILGPTAGGKTELAVELAKQLGAHGVWGAELIVADSMQVYRGLDIGTAKSTAAQRRQVPHHLLDLVDPWTEGFSVDRWLELAEAAITEIRTRGRYPIVVGGTNLYVQALLEGLLDGPGPNAALRRQLETAGLDDLRRRLARIDPAAAQRIHPNDRKRTVRAIEVFVSTGRPISQLQTQWGRATPRRDVRIIGLDYSSGAINARINARVRQMIADGLLAETHRIWVGGNLGRQASVALGYRQLIDHLQGRWSLSEAVEQIKIRTRRLARKQRSWLKRFRGHPDSVWIKADDLTPQELVAKALGVVRGRPGESRHDRDCSPIGALGADGVCFIEPV